jgi:hypothetical protein
MTSRLRRRRLTLFAGFGGGIVACGIWSGGVGQGDAGKAPGAPADAFVPSVDALVEDAGPPDVGVADGATDADAIVDTGFDAGCPFGVDDTIEATLTATADNYRVLYVNGVLIDDVTYGWSQPTTYVVKVFRHPSRKNVIAIKGTNIIPLDGRDRGILADLALGTAAGPHIVTNGEWLVTSSTPTASWIDPGFVEGGWLAATSEAPVGSPPWNALAGFVPSSMWIWTYDSNLSKQQKVGDEIVYARRTFFFDVAGAPHDGPSACP